MQGRQKTDYNELRRECLIAMLNGGLLYQTSFMHGGTPVAAYVDANTSSGGIRCIRSPTREGTLVGEGPKRMINFR